MMWCAIKELQLSRDLQFSSYNIKNHSIRNSIKQAYKKQWSTSTTIETRSMSSRIGTWLEKIKNWIWNWFNWLRPCFLIYTPLFHPRPQLLLTSQTSNNFLSFCSRTLVSGIPPSLHIPSPYNDLFSLHIQLSSRWSQTPNRIPQRLDQRTRLRHQPISRSFSWSSSSRFRTLFGSFLVATCQQDTA